MTNNMATQKYVIGVDYPYNGTMPDIPIGTLVEIIWPCGTRNQMRQSKDNTACWHPRIYDPSIVAFCILEYPQNYIEGKL